MKNLLYAVATVIVSVGVSFVFFGKSVEQKLGSYTPPVQSTSGYSQSLTQSSTLAANSFCVPTNIQITGTTGNTTTTLPAATSTFASCTNLQNLGASVQGLLVNDSPTNTAQFAAGTGVTVKCETQGVGTSTLAGGSLCTSSGFTVGTGTVVAYNVYFDGSSSTLNFIVGNNWK